MVLVWPSALPQAVDRKNHSQQFGDGRLPSPTDIGPGIVGRRSSAMPRPIIGDLHLTFPQKSRFDRWIEADTKGGTQPFLFPAIGLHGFPLLGDDETPLLDFDGRRLLNSCWWLVRLSDKVELPRCVPYGTGWLASVALLVLPTNPVLPI